MANPANKKAVIALALMVCAVVAVTLVGHFEQETVRETTTLEAKAAKLLKSVTSLRAYALLARDKAIDFKKDHSSGDTGLVNFIIKFGEGVSEQDDAEKAQSAKEHNALLIAEGNGELTASTEEKFNVIVSYAKAMAECKKDFNAGINQYVLEHLDDAVRSGEDVLKKYHGRKYTGLSGDVSGLTSDAEYLKKLSVSSLKYASELVAVQGRAAHADVKAASMWLLSGEEDQYKSFLSRAKDEVKQRVAAHKASTVADSLKAIKDNFDRDGDLNSLPSAGNKAAALAPALEAPDTHQLKAAATAKAEAWKDENEGSATAEDEVESTEGEDDSSSP